MLELWILIEPNKERSRFSEALILLLLTTSPAADDLSNRRLWYQFEFIITHSFSLLLCCDQPHAFEPPPISAAWHRTNEHLLCLLPAQK